MQGELRLQAIVLGLVDTGESDRVVTLLSRERGRLAVFAAGARKSKRRFAGALEPFNRLEVRLRERRGSLFFLNSCEIRDGFPGLREELSRIAHAGHAAELCRELFRDGEAQEALFDELATYLSKLSQGCASSEDLLAFELLALREAGVAPRFSDCAICGGVLEREMGLCDPAHGGSVCPRCAGQRHPGAFRISEATRSALAELQIGGTTRVAEDPQTRAQARQAIRRFTYQAAGKRLRTLDFLEQLGIEG